MAQQGGEDKNSMQILWLIGFVFAIGIVVWMNFGDQLKEAFIVVRYAQIFIIYQVAQFIPFFGISEKYGQLLTFLEGAGPESLTLQNSELISTYAGYGMLPLYLVIIFFLWRKVSKKAVTANYKKNYDMHALVRQERVLWPHSNILKDIDLLKEDLDEGPWAMAETPMHFAKRNKLLDIEVVPPSKGNLKDGPTFKAVVNKHKAEQIFSAQLGRLWRGPEYLPDYKQAMFAAFIARGCRDSARAADFLLEINHSIIKEGKPNLDGAKEIWQKHWKKPEVQEVIQAHAYESTIFTALFLFARQDGVFPTADFMWLKPQDRRFWYILNNVGRQTPAVEAAGVHAHFLAEKALNRPLTVPMVKEATKAFEFAISEIIYEPSREERQRLLKEWERKQK